MNGTEYAVANAEALDALEAALGTSFRDRELLLRALVHRSYLNENAEAGLESNERLEFLGDAVLGFVTARWLYRRFPGLAEGPLTEMRAALVRRETLALAGARLGLGDLLMLGRGEAQAGGREREANLARVYEAVIGAIAEDSGLVKAERAIVRSLARELREVDGREVIDPKSQLQHIAQSRWHQPPRYTMVAVEGPDHARQFEVEVEVAGETLGRGAGNSKQGAERAAAIAALAHIADDNDGARARDGGGRLGDACT